MKRYLNWRGLLTLLSFGLVACGNSATTGSVQVCATVCTAGESCMGGTCVPAEGGPADGGTSGGGAGGASSGGSPSAGGASDGGAHTPDAAGFCNRWIDEFAQYMGACGCDATTMQRYRDQSATLCAPGGFLATPAAPDAGAGLVYHAEAADALFARLRAPDPLCVEEPFRALKLDSLELYSLGGVFTGTRALGDPCALPVGYKGGISDCREGFCARNVGGEGGVCIALVGLGEECDASGDQNFNSGTQRLCFERRLSDSDGEYESAFDSLTCVPTASGATTHVCARDLADGDPCNSGAGCRSGRCLDTRVCGAKLLDGQPCTRHADCATGACQTGTPRVCGALLANGEPCDYDDRACASGSCNDPNGSGGFCGPPPSGNPGEACSSSVECVSSGSGDSRDKVCAGGRCVADVCAGYLP